MSSRGRSDFLTKPRAPASSALRTMRPESCIVRVRILVLGTTFRIWRIASSPSNSGISISTIATSGFNFLAFSTASKPFAASATTFQLCCDRRHSHMPQRMSSWSSATSIRSLSGLSIIGGDCYSHRCALIAGFNLQCTTNLFDAFLHARDANTDAMEWRLGQFLIASSKSMAFIDDLDRELFLVTFDSYSSLWTSRMALNVCQTLLYYPEQS